MARAFWLAAALAVGAVVIALPVGARFEGVAVPPASTAPTLRPGDCILVDASRLR